MSFFIVRFSHKHGSDVWPVFTKEEPGESDIVAELKAADVWDDGDDNRLDTYVEVTGPFENPLEAPLRNIIESYDDAGCEGCGVVGGAEYKAGKAAVQGQEKENQDA